MHLKCFFKLEIKRSNIPDSSFYTKYYVIIYFNKFLAFMILCNDRMNVIAFL